MIIMLPKETDDGGGEGASASMRAPRRKPANEVKEGERERPAGSTMT